MKILLILLMLVMTAGTACCQTTVLHDVTVIDGTGTAGKTHQNVLISGDRILVITSVDTAIPNGAIVIALEGKILMPLIVDCDAHLGLLKDTATAAANYTPENIGRHLLRLQDYGVGAVLSMGTDHLEIFGMREASHAGNIPGATIYTAGLGFGVKNGAPPGSAGMDKVYRPTTPAEAREEMREIAARKPDVIKIWVDDFLGRMPKMKPEIYQALIDEAHLQGVRVASHLFYAEDARSLVNSGLDIMAHSIRDRVIDDALLAEMKRHNIVYIPTLSLDEFAFSYEGTPAWIRDPFFRAALEPGVYEMISSPAYKNRVRNNPATAKEIAALSAALKNLKKIYEAGITIALGTDAGAQPIRVMGFSEHMEMELMVRAGIPPLQV